MTLTANLLLVVVIIAASFQCNSVASLTADEYVDNTPSWAKAFQCTITTDGGKPILMNESTCTTTAKDASDKPCIWCDATATIGTGICVSSNVKGMTGQYWDQFCKSSSNTDPNPPVGPVPTTPSPTTPPPTPPPVPNDIPDSLRCSMDASHNVITDKTKCTTEQKDASNNPCYWCNIPLLGGTCVTDSMKSTLGFMCQDQQEQPNMATLFVQLVEKIGTAWKQFDPSCFGDFSIGFITNKDVCTARTDKNGRDCVWLDAPSGEEDADDKFGICATIDQKEYVCSHMDCDDKTQQMEDNLDTTVVDNVVNVE